MPSCFAVERDAAELGAAEGDVVLTIGAFPPACLKDCAASGWRRDSTTARSRSRTPRVSAPELLEDDTRLGVHRVLRVDAPVVGGEHVRVGLRPPLGAVAVGPGDGNTRLLRVLGRQEEERALRDDREGLGVGFLHRCRDRGGVGLVIDDEWHQLVAVHPTLGVLQVEPGGEPCRRRRVLCGPGARDRRDVGDGDRRSRRTSRCGRCRQDRQREKAEHAERGARDPQAVHLCPRPPSTPSPIHGKRHVA